MTSMPVETPFSYLAFLPVEVWRACWTLCSRRQLRRLSLVCHLFRCLCLPLLLQEQTFDVAVVMEGLCRTNWMDRIPRFHRTAVRMEKLIESRLAPFVRSWKATIGPDIAADKYARMRIRCLPDRLDWQDQHFVDTMHDKVLTAFTTTLGSYKNLSSLTLQHFTLDTPIRDTLVSLPMLSDLRLYYCRITARNGFLPLKSLKISGYGRPDTGGPLQIASPDSIRTLDIDDTKYISPMLAGFGSVKLTNLVSLSIGRLLDAADAADLFRLLAQSPRLETLSKFPFPGERFPTLHHSGIPFLHTLAGPPLLIQSLAPNRPIRCATVVDDGTGIDPEQLMRVCTDLSRSTAPLQSLTLPRTSWGMTPTFLHEVAALFPDLRELEITVSSGKQAFRPRPSTTHGGPTRVIMPVDTRLLVLHDDEVFDNPPADELSDAEDDEPNITLLTKAPTEIEISPAPGVPNTVLCITERRVSLPPNIEVFRMVARSTEMLSRPEEHRAIAALAALYPLLRELQFGSPLSGWKWMGGFWKSECGNLCVGLAG
ncbi:hypothetical protein B0H11DRAFT_2019994 [Mycena galericulata]|nr:hypothetical protein B0H11DRAFT_2019994 [Mycena galericulata]